MRQTTSETPSPDRDGSALSSLVWLLPAAGFVLIYLAGQYLDSDRGVADSNPPAKPAATDRTNGPPPATIASAAPATTQTHEKQPDHGIPRSTAAADEPPSGSAESYLPAEPNAAADAAPWRLPPLPGGASEAKPGDDSEQGTDPPPREPPDTDRANPSPSAAEPDLVPYLVQPWVPQPYLPKERYADHPSPDPEPPLPTERFDPRPDAEQPSLGTEHLSAPENERPPTGEALAELAAIDRRAEQHVREAFSLADRGALYSARTELIQALRLVSQSLDMEQRTTRHAAALARGMRALQEMEDFIPRGTQLEGDLDMRALIGSHRTPVLKQQATDPRQAAELSPTVAMQQYLEYAQRQLVDACRRRPAGSLALYGMGRLHMALGESSVDSGRLNHPRAMALYQAAVMTDPANYMAANELGVMLARYGRLESAREVLQLAAGNSPQPETWRNLAVVHRQLGEHRLAERADREMQAVRTRPRMPIRAVSQPAAPRDPVEWVPPEAFSGPRTASPPQTYPTQTSLPRGNPPGGAAPAATSPPVEQRVGWLTEWLERNR